MGLNKKVSVGQLVMLSRHHQYQHSEGNPTSSIGVVFRKHDDGVANDGSQGLLRVKWSNGRRNLYRYSRSDLIPLFGEGYTRDELRTIARLHQGLVVVDNGKEAENRWQLSVESI